MAKVAWNKGLRGDPRSKRSAETRRKISQIKTGRTFPDSFKKTMSEVAKRRCLGGHTSKIRIWYKMIDGSEIYLQSSFEVRMAQLLDRMQIAWSRPEPLIWTDCSGHHRYYPDFKVGNIYLDTKNEYLAVKDLPKINTVKEQNGVDLRIVREHEITEDYIYALKAKW